MKSSIYIVGNIFFIQIGESFSTDVPPKYLQAGSTGIFTCNIWTEEEILAKYPNAKPCKNLQNIGKVWNT